MVYLSVKCHIGPMHLELSMDIVLAVHLELDRQPVGNTSMGDEQCMHFGVESQSERHAFTVTCEVA